MPVTCKTYTDGLRRDALSAEKTLQLLMVFDDNAIHWGASGTHDMLHGACICFDGTATYYLISLCTIEKGGMTCSTYG